MRIGNKVSSMRRIQRRVGTFLCKICTFYFMPWLCSGYVIMGKNEYMSESPWLPVLTLEGQLIIDIRYVIGQYEIKKFT